MLFASEPTCSAAQSQPDDSASTDAYDLTDGTGLRFGDELEWIGFRGDEDVRLAPPHAFVVRVREMVDSGDYGRLRATVGHIATSPALPSVVPDRADLTVDLQSGRRTHGARRARPGRVPDRARARTTRVTVEARRMAKTRQVLGVLDALAGAAAGTLLGRTSRFPRVLRSHR